MLVGHEFKKWANHEEREVGATGSRRENVEGGEYWVLEGLGMSGIGEPGG